MTKSLLLENLPASPESIALPDFTPRSFDTNDYAKAKAEIEKQGKATLKIIQDATGLNKVSAKRIMEYFVTAGYVNKKGNKFEFVGTDNQIYNADGTRKLSTDIEENKKLDAPLGTIPMDSIFTPIKNVKYSIEDYRVEQKTDYEKLLGQHNIFKFYKGFQFPC